MKRVLTFFLALCVLGAAVSAQAFDLPGDGEYTVEVSLIGGSGRAGVASPARVSIENSRATAEIIWSSPNYEFMIVGGETYHPVQGRENSTFEIPVTLDADISFSAQTLAMSRPHLIEYTLRFEPATLKPLKAAQSAKVFVWALPILALLALVAAVAATAARRGKKIDSKDKTP
jgi:hypothetical protein